MEAVQKQHYEAPSVMNLEIATSSGLLQTSNYNYYLLDED